MAGAAARTQRRYFSGQRTLPGDTAVQRAAALAALGRQRIRHRSFSGSRPLSCCRHPRIVRRPGACAGRMGRRPCDTRLPRLALSPGNAAGCGGAVPGGGHRESRGGDRGECAAAGRHREFVWQPRLVRLLDGRCGRCAGGGALTAGTAAACPGMAHRAAGKMAGRRRTAAAAGGGAACYFQQSPAAGLFVDTLDFVGRDALWHDRRDAGDDHRHGHRRAL